MNWMSLKCFQIATTANFVSFVQKMARVLYSAWRMQAAEVECMPVRCKNRTYKSFTRKNDVKY